MERTDLCTSKYKNLIKEKAHVDSKMPTNNGSLDIDEDMLNEKGEQVYSQFMSYVKDLNALDKDEEKEKGKEIEIDKEKEGTGKEREQIILKIICLFLDHMSGPENDLGVHKVSVDCEGEEYIMKREETFSIGLTITTVIICTTKTVTLLSHIMSANCFRELMSDLERMANDTCRLNLCNKRAQQRAKNIFGIELRANTQPLNVRTDHYIAHDTGRLYQFALPSIDSDYWQLNEPKEIEKVIRYPIRNVDTDCVQVKSPFTHIPLPNCAEALGKIYRHSFPQSKSEIMDMKQNNIKLITVLDTGNSRILDGLTWNYKHALLDWELFSIEDFSSPTREELRKHLTIIKSYLKRGFGVLVHCQAGQGRTGLVLAFLVSELLGLSGADAIEYLRKFFPAVESKYQFEFVEEFCKDNETKQLPINPANISLEPMISLEGIPEYVI